MENFRVFQSKLTKIFQTGQKLGPDQAACVESCQYLLMKSEL